MNKPFNNVVAALALSQVLAAQADNELAVQFNIAGEEASNYSVILNGSAPKSISLTGLVIFNLQAGQHQLQLVNAGKTVETVSFSTKAEELADITIDVNGAIKSAVTLFSVADVASSKINTAGLPRGKSQAAPLDIPVPEVNGTIEEVSVLGKINTSALEVTERYSTNVVNTIDTEQFERFGDSTAASALSRIVGVTVTDSKYANVRGLDGRYISSTLNGMLMPSTDPIRRDVQLDLFPSNILGGIEIQKSYSADALGTTTGGAVKMFTKGLPDNYVNKISVSLGVNSEFTGDDIVSYEESQGDAFGYDSGLRDLPGGVLGATDGGRSLTVCDPSIDSRCTSPIDAAVLGVKFQNDYNVDDKTAAPDYGVSYSIGDRVGLDEGEFGYYFAANFKSEIENRESAKLTDPLDTNGSYQRSKEKINASAYLVAGYEFGEFDEVLSKTIILRSTDDVTRVETGVDSEDNQVDEVIFEWVEREFIAQHFSGRHIFNYGDQDHQLNWSAGYSMTDRYEPDRRTYTYLNNSLATSALERRWSELEEDSTDVNVEYTLPFNLNADVFMEVKVGAMYSDRSREVDLYRFGIRAGENADDISFSIDENLEEVLSYQNYALDRVRLAAKTTDTDSYDADETTQAIYAALQTDIGDAITLVAGVRQEEFESELDYPNDDSASNLLESDEDLPSLALTYRINEDLQLRAGWSNTVSYPGLIERSESLSYDPNTDDPIFGNPDLLVSDIENYDLRLEYYFSEFETISIAYFIKEIDNPVERAVTDGSGSAAQGSTFRNAKSADLYGIEIDVSKNIFLDNDYVLIVGGNVSYIDSEVDPDDRSIELGDKKGRELQGQSPWLANLQLGLDHDPSMQKFTLLVNYFDDRIYQLTRGANVDNEIENGRIVVDLTYEKTFGDRDNMVIKGKIENLLNEEVAFSRGGQDIESYEDGTSFSLGFSYEFE
ncbi:TonB-dependent receptor domain-containing protein [Oceanicoccus sp. KOV_DT_Chl]|uniref:TonB-dependent receptor domain-containing protein n=1 Tax=Oceanicoccus sp. KOV_DT_Chl TaxID=1904639 RepID=UPI000C7B7F6B|nr:TonB-dependent receptor [Oceanicoccus sp. KOV_DT_Chl]